jgi:hypothetical protein
MKNLNDLISNENSVIVSKLIEELYDMNKIGASCYLEKSISSEHELYSNKILASRDMARREELAAAYNDKFVHCAIYNAKEMAGI